MMQPRQNWLERVFGDLDANDYVFGIGLFLLTLGIAFIYWPASPIVGGCILMALALSNLFPRERKER